MDLSVALDALFGIKFDSSYRLPIRVATLLCGHGDETRELLARVKKLWGLRNKLAHGRVNVKNLGDWNNLSQSTPELRPCSTVIG